MTRYTSRADLLIAAGESIKMQEKAGIEPVFKSCYGIEKMWNVNFTLNPDRYEFPLAVVEGKPVFVGDELYDEKGRIWIADNENYATNKPDQSLWFGYEHMSWNPPKPATVMVELLREDAEHYSRSAMIDQREERFQSACRKALEKA